MAPPLATTAPSLTSRAHHVTSLPLTPRKPSVHAQAKRSTGAASRHRAHLPGHVTPRQDADESAPQSAPVPVASDLASTSASARSIASAPGTSQTPPFPRRCPVAVVINDEARRTRDGHRRRLTAPDLHPLHRDHRDARRDLLSSTPSSPMPLIARSITSPSATVTTRSTSSSL